MPRSVLEAVKLGLWDFEPEDAAETEYSPTQSLPGSTGKLSVLEHRLQRGLPLWHPADRLVFAEEADDADFG